jgi:predicted flap endonuclease-1-like 5' DNA nuclease
MPSSVEKIQGIGPAYAKALESIGIRNTDQLLAAGRTKLGRGQLAETTGLSESLILGWVNMADLFRIKGVAGQYAELLEASGVDTVRELRNRNPENRAAKMAEINRQRKVCKNVPSTSTVAVWIEAAKTLPPAVEH